MTGAVLPLTVVLAGGQRGVWHLGAGQLALVVAAWVALLARERAPLAVLAAVTALDAARIIVTGHNEPASSTFPLMTMLAAYTAACKSAPNLAWGGAAAAGLTQFLVATVDYRYAGASLLYFNWTLGGAAIGSLVRERRRRVHAAERRADEAERTRESEALRRVTEERVRIARELHDSLAHHITVVNAQAGVAQYLLRTDPDAAEAALSGIATNTRAALDELRATLGLLRDDQTPDDRTPTPTFEQLTTLVTNVRSAGVALEVQIDGTPRVLGPVADVAAYRIVQEALSNATRHAAGAEVQLRVQWTDTELHLEVTNGPAADPLTDPVRGSGHGLIGMRERATTAGGTFNAGPTDAGGFAVQAVLPLGAAPNGTAAADAPERGRAL